MAYPKIRTTINQYNIGLDSCVMYIIAYLLKGDLNFSLSGSPPHISIYNCLFFLLNSNIELSYSIVCDDLYTIGFRDGSFIGLIPFSFILYS